MGFLGVDWRDWKTYASAPYAITKGAYETGKAVVSGDGGGVLGGGTGAIQPNFNVANYGGSPEASAAYTEQYQQGIENGQGIMYAGNQETLKGLYTAGRMDDNASQAIVDGRAMTADASRNAEYDRNRQVQAANMQRDAAMGKAPSAAQRMLMANADASRNAMMGQAASARGGNQAAAMRTAAATGNAGMLAAGQQAGVLRAQEMADARAAYGSLATDMRGQDMGQAQLGVGMTGMGLNAQGQAANTMVAGGTDMARLGAAREAAYLGALSDQQKSEMVGRTDLENTRIGGQVAQRASNQAFMGGVFGTIGGVAGGMYGGPAGAAAGYTAGNAAGRSAY